MRSLLSRVMGIGSQAVALPTVAGSAKRDLRIVFIERMAVRAMRFAGVHAGRPKPTQLVLAARNRFQMCRVYADRSSTKMVKFQSCRDFTNHQFVSHPVSLIMATAGKGELPVAMAVLPCCPQPAGPEVGTVSRYRPALVDFGPKSLIKWFRLRGHRGTSIPGVMRATVTAVRPLSIVLRPLSSDGALTLGAGMVAI